MMDNINLTLLQDFSFFNREQENWDLIPTAVFSNEHETSYCNILYGSVYHSAVTLADNLCGNFFKYRLYDFFKTIYYLKDLFYFQLELLINSLKKNDKVVKFSIIQKKTPQKPSSKEIYHFRP